MKTQAERAQYDGAAEKPEWGIVLSTHCFRFPASRIVKVSISLEPSTLSQGVQAVGDATMIDYLYL